MTEKENCTFRPIFEYGSCSTGSKTKLGRYHGSFWPGVPIDKYPLGVYFDGDLQKLKSDGLSEEQIVEQIIASLNEQTVGKRKNKTTPKYGHLTKYSYEFKMDDKGQEYIVAILLTDDRKNTHFWGEGAIRYGNEGKKRKRAG